ncbi:glutaminyl-peptide cyclotransferase [archaeon]|nr:MAG: glutaminyl-peptide cyclotransferase [archaeon]
MFSESRLHHKINSGLLMAAIMFFTLLWCFICVLSVPVGVVVDKSVEEIPHDSNCFTQGLEIHNGIMYESCGLYGRSSLRKVNMKTGKSILTQTVSRELFAEGITIHNNTIYLLTWKAKKALLYDLHSLTLKDTKHFSTPTGEGWGAATDGHSLIVSDGSDTITFFKIPSINDGISLLTKVKEIKVYDPLNSRHIGLINELEYVNGKLYSNVWYKDVILEIDPENGAITRRFDLTNLYPKQQRIPNADCLNGIAYDPSDQHFILTGKKWPKYFRVNLTTYSYKKANDL